MKKILIYGYIIPKIKNIRINNNTIKLSKGEINYDETREYENCWQKRN